VEEEIEFMRAENDEKARLQRERLEMAWNEESTPEPEQEPGSETDFIFDVGSRGVPNFEESDDELDEPAMKVSRKRKAPTEKESSEPKKKRGRPSKADRAAQAGKKDVLELVREKNAAKKARGKKGPKATAGKGKGKATKYEGPSMMNQNSLLGSNIFQDAERTRDLPEQPTFGDTTLRSSALKQLVADVPAESRKLAQVDMKYLERAIQSFTGQKSVYPAADGNWHVKGMKVTLKHYQVLGTAFMRQRENSSKEPKGGILADQMGLGKTIMMLANIVNGQPLVGRKKCKTTLIVASPALMAQWRREIADKVYTKKEDKVHGIGRVKEFSSAAQLRSNQEQEELEDVSIVPISYTTLYFLSVVAKTYAVLTIRSSPGAPYHHGETR